MWWCFDDGLMTITMTPKMTTIKAMLAAVVMLIAMKRR